MAAAAAFDPAPPDWDISIHREAPADCDVLVAVGVSVPGALELDPDRPEAVIDAIRRTTMHRRLIVVVGASGGSGATSLALHLAAASARREPTAVVDLHPQRAAAVRLGIAEDLPEGSETPVVQPVNGGFRLVLPADDGRDLTAALEGAFDRSRRVVVDSPTDRLGDLADPADRVILVLTPTVPAAHKGAALVAAYPACGWVPVTNRTGPGGETTRVDIERILGLRISMELPCSPGLRDAEDDSRLLTSALSPWRSRVARLSEAL